jgi:hypothetical protein
MLLSQAVAVVAAAVAMVPVGNNLVLAVEVDQDILPQDQL